MAFRLFLLVLITTAVWTQETVSQQTSDPPLLDHSIPKILIVGPTGSGKSSMANSLLGLDPQKDESVLFKVCSGWDSCTKETTFATGNWLGSGPKFTVVDTPGLSDSDGDDTKHIREMLHVLKNTVKSVDAIVLLLKGTENRFNAGIKAMLLQMSSIFGEQFWQFLLIGVSFWEYDQISIDYRSKRCPGKNCFDENWFIKEFEKQLKDKLYQTGPFTFAFIHSFSQIEDNKYDAIQQQHWLEETGKLWSFVTDKRDSFQLKGVDDILEDNSRLKRELKDLKDEHETRIGNLEKNGVTPVGTIVAWVNKPVLHYTPTGKENLMANLPDGWMKCNGDTITRGIWAGKTLPNLNGGKRFLRGGLDTDTLKMEEDTLRQHKHNVDVGTHVHHVQDAGHSHYFIDRYNDNGSPCSCNGGVDGVQDHDRWTSPSKANIQERQSKSSVTVKEIRYDGNVPHANRGTEETRPKNMCVIYIMKVW